MNMISVRSSAIAAVGYDPNMRLLRIRFTSGADIYDFCGVPQQVYEGLISAHSMGSYYDRYIRDRYHC
jgi:hypothetical protein